MDTELSARQKLELNARVVDLRLKEFVTLSDEIFNASATTKSFLKFWKRIPYEKLKNESIEIANKLSNLANTLQSPIRNEIYSHLNFAEQNFFDCLVEFACAIADSSEILSQNQEMFYLRSCNKRTLTLKETMERSELYNKSMEKYHAIGIQLQNLYNALP